MKSHPTPALILTVTTLFLYVLSFGTPLLAQEMTTSEESVVINNENLTDLSDGTEDPDAEESDTEEVRATLPENREIHNFSPSVQDYELYDGVLALWGVDALGDKPLIATVEDTSIETIMAWLDMIKTAQLFNKGVKVLYNTETDRIVSIYGPK